MLGQSEEENNFALHLLSAFDLMRYEDQLAGCDPVLQMQHQLGNICLLAINHKVLVVVDCILLLESYISRNLMMLMWSFFGDWS